VPEINEALAVCYEDLVECYDVLKEGQLYGYEVASKIAFYSSPLTNSGFVMCCH
jgi:hypothetical protein